MLGIDAAWAQAKVTITREESKPQTVGVKAHQRTGTVVVK